MSAAEQTFASNRSVSRWNLQWLKCLKITRNREKNARLLSFNSTECCKDRATRGWAQLAHLPPATHTCSRKAHSWVPWSVPGRGAQQPASAHSQRRITSLWVLSGWGYCCQKAARASPLPSSELEKRGVLPLCFAWLSVLSTCNKQIAGRPLAPRPWRAQPEAQLVWQPQLEIHSAQSSSVVLSMY